MSHKQPFDIRGLVGSYADLARPENDTNRFGLEDLTSVMSEVVIKNKEQDDDVGDGGDDGNDGGDIGGDIYIMMKCMCVTKNHHFLLGVSCNHLNPP